MIEKINVIRLHIYRNIYIYNEEKRKQGKKKRKSKKREIRVQDIIFKTAKLGIIAGINL